MATTYDYSLSIDFPNGFNAEQLSIAIGSDPLITTFLISIIIDTINPDIVHITFASALSPSELTELNILIANFVPTPDGEPLIIESTFADDNALQLIANTGGILINSDINIYQRYINGGFIKSQQAPTVLASIPLINLTINNIVSNIIYGTPIGGGTILVVPTPASVVAHFAYIAVNDSIDFHIINQSASNNYILGVPLSVITIGSGTITSLTTGYFRIWITNINAGTEAYTLFRLA